MLSSLTASGRLRTKIRWLDNNVEENKDKLVTNDEALDLIHKQENQVQPINNHKKDFAGKGALKIKTVKEEAKVK